MAILKSYRIVLSIILTVISIKVGSINCAALSEKTVVNNAASSPVQIDNFQVFTSIKYRYARTMVFCQMYNPHPSQGQEALFQLEIPEDAFISNFTMEINGTKFKSFIKERKEANDRYAGARGNGFTTGLVNKEEHFFNISINLAANSSVLFFLEYEEEIPKLANGEGHFYQYALSLIPEMVKVKHFCVDIDILEYKPIGAIKADHLRSKNGMSTVQLDWEKEAVMLYTEGKNRTRVIWEPSTDTFKQLSESGIVGKFLLTYRFEGQEPINDVVIRNGFFVHRFDLRNSMERLPLHVIFVLDTSGSMIGLRGNRTKDAMEKVLLNDMKKSQDFFHVITFSSTVQHLDLGSNLIKRFYPATDTLKIRATEFINKQVFDGSTNIHDALMAALETATNSSALHDEFCQQLENLGQNSASCDGATPAPTPMIFFLTDGYPTTGIIDRQTILKHVQIKNTNRVPIFSIGLGTEADHSLLEALSIMNHGIARKIYNDADVVLQLENFYQFVASPVLKDIKLWYTNINANSPTSSFGLAYDTDRHFWLSSRDEILVIGKLNNQHPYKPTNPNQKDGNHANNGNNIGTSSGHGLHTHHGNFNYQGHTTFNIEMKHAEFQARVCLCGICPQSGDNNNGSHFLSSYQQDGTLCPKDDEDRFMERFWIHKTLKKLIKEVVANGSESIKQEIIGLSKLYNLVTPFTSLLIRTPIDNKRSNEKNYDPPSVPNIMKNTEDSSLDNDIVQKSSLPDRESYPRKPEFYSGSVKSSNGLSNQTNQRTSLISFFKSLQDAQENLIKNQTVSSNLPTAKPKLSIDDVEWAVGHNFSLPLRNNRNENIGSKCRGVKINAMHFDPEQNLLTSCSMPGTRLCIKHNFIYDGIFLSDKNNRIWNDYQIRGNLLYKFADF